MAESKAEPVPCWQVEKAAEGRPETAAEPAQHLEAETAAESRPEVAAALEEDETVVANRFEQVVASEEAETAAVSKPDLAAASPLELYFEHETLVESKSELVG
jgi:hypothetical protein